MLNFFFVGVTCPIACPSGYVYISGTFTSSTITFGSYTLSSAGGADVFWAKINSAGTVIYAERYGGQSVLLL